MQSIVFHYAFWCNCCAVAVATVTSSPFSAVFFSFTFVMAFISFVIVIIIVVATVVVYWDFFLKWNVHGGAPQLYRFFFVVISFFATRFLIRWWKNNARKWKQLLNNKESYRLWSVVDFCFSCRFGAITWCAWIPADLLLYCLSLCISI